MSTRPIYVLGEPGEPGQALWLRREVDQYATLGARDGSSSTEVSMSAKDISDLIAALTDLHAGITRITGRRT